MATATSVKGVFRQATCRIMLPPGGDERGQRLHAALDAEKYLVASLFRKENEEDDEFRRAVADAKPLAPRRRAEPHGGASRLFQSSACATSAPCSRSRSAAEPRRRDRFRNELAYLGEAWRDVLRKLRRGHWVVEDELDLHGMNRHMAAIGVTEFLRHCRQRRLAACASSTAKAAARINASRC